MRRKRNRWRVKRSDYSRALVTDTLPSEVPLIFSNEGLYKTLSLNGSISALRLRVLESLVCKSTGKWSAPYFYNIRKSSSEFRRLGLLHPRDQFGWTLFYKQYDERILELCRNSSMSIRAPKRVARTFYSPADLAIKNVTKDSDYGIENDEDRLQFSTSYFSYRGYTRLYQMYSSSEFLDLEKRFSVFKTLDVARCFDSIYTHTMDWAVSSKKYSKENLREKSFGSDFDKQMQVSNNGETNGIVIGPEVSRIFAEIIFQKIDLIAEEMLRVDKLKYEIDYVVKRYVDDVMIFASNQDVAEMVYQRYSQALREFNLSPNTAKSICLKRPFVTSKSRSILEVSAVCASFVEELFLLTDEAIKARGIKSAERLSVSFINKIKVLCLGQAIAYDEVSSFIISTLTRRMVDAVQSEVATAEASDRENLADVVMVLLDVLFFFYSVAPSVAASYTLGRAVVIIIRFARAQLVDWEVRISERVSAHIREFTEKAGASVHKIVGSHVPLEVINVLLIARELDDSYSVDEETVTRVFVPSLVAVEDYDWSYFEIVSCLFFVRNDARYANLKSELLAMLDVKMSDLNLIETDAEKAHLVLDLTSCPYIDVVRRKGWLASACAALQLAIPSAVELDEYVAEDERFWFVKWSGLDILNTLQKKELSPAY